MPMFAPILLVKRVFYQMHPANGAACKPGAKGRGV